jgi:hypothetical protein
VVDDSVRAVGFECAVTPIDKWTAKSSLHVSCRHGDSRGKGMNRQHSKKCSPRAAALVNWQTRKSFEDASEMPREFDA